jgi:hypothetical protein
MLDKMSQEKHHPTDDCLHHSCLACEAAKQHGWLVNSYSNTLLLFSAALQQ